MRSFCNALIERENIPLRSLSMANVGMQFEHAEILAGAIGKLAHPKTGQLKHLDVSRNNLLGQHGREVIFKAVADSSIERLVVDFSGKPKEFLVSGADATPSAATATKQSAEPANVNLDMSQKDGEVPIGTDELALLTHWVARIDDTLERVSLDGNTEMIGELSTSKLATQTWENHHKEQFGNFCKALADTENLLELSLRDVQLGPLAAAVLAESLIKMSKTVRDLDVSGNPLGEEGLTQIFEAIVGSTVERLCIDFGPKNAGYVFDRKNTKLDLCGRELRPQEIKLLSLWIHHTSDSIKEIHLDNNSGLVGEALTSFCGALKRADAMTLLSVSDAGLDLTAGLELAATTASMRSLGSLNLSRNQLVSVADWDALGSDWSEFCGHLSGSSALRNLDLSSCIEGAEPAKALARILCEEAGSIVSLNLSDNNIFTMTGGRDDPGGWQALCAALHHENCAVEEFYAARVGLAPLRLHSLFTQQESVREFPQRIRRLDLSGNHFATRIPFQAPKHVMTLNNDKGGKTGTNGWTKLCGVDKKVPLGVILTNGPCQRILKILKREETWKKESATRPEDQVLDVIDTFNDSADQITVLKALKEYNAYDPREVFIGSYRESQHFWSVLSKHDPGGAGGCNKLVHLELVDCEIDTKAVLQLAAAVKTMDCLETMRMSATGAGPWRGRFGLRVPPTKEQQAPVYDLKLTPPPPPAPLAQDGNSSPRRSVHIQQQQQQQIRAGGIVELNDKGLGPEDAALIAAWMTRPQVRDKWSKIKLTSNPIFGNKHLHEDEARMEGIGEYRILTPGTVLWEQVPKSDLEVVAEHSGKSLCLKRATNNNKFSPGQVIKVTEYAKFEDTFPDHGKQERVLPGLRLQVNIASKYSSFDLWLNTRDSEGTTVAKRVRSHQGWEALSQAMVECYKRKPRPLVLEVDDTGMGTTAIDLAKKHGVQEAGKLQGTEGAFMS